MLSTPDICCSIGVATACSTVRGVGAGVGGVDLDLRRHDVGKLRDRQAGHGDETDDGHQDRDDHGHDRPVDEEP